MAVTAIWSVKGRLEKVINYTVNPDKTFNPDYSDSDLQSMKDVIDYAMDSDKTEKEFYVTGVNCTPGFARDQMINTKKLFKKEDGILAFHGYQAFKPDEVTPEVAHEIGIKLAEKLWGDRFEIVVTTHLDKKHIHNHFVLNSVSFVDGLKFNDCNESYHRMRKVSDDICREYGLSVIEKPHKALSRMQYLAEKEGKMSKCSLIKRDLTECVQMSAYTERFRRLMEERGYSVFFIGEELAVSHKYLSSPVRLCDLGEGFSSDEIMEFIYHNRYNKRLNLPVQSRIRDLFFDGDLNNRYVTYYDLYSHFVPGLIIITENPKENRFAEFFLQKEIMKLDQFCEEQNLLCGNNVESYEDLIALKEDREKESLELVDLRKNLRNELKRVKRSGNEKREAEIKGQIKDISARLSVLRKDIRVCDRVIARDTQVKNKMDELHEHAIRQERYAPQRRINKIKEDLDDR